MSPFSSRVSFFALLVAGLFVLVLSGAAVAGATQQSDTTPPNANSSITAELQSDGDARWTISTTYNLSNQNKTVIYQQIAEEFRAGSDPRTSVESSHSILGIASFERAAASVNQHTDREMRIENPQRRTASATEVANGTGRLTIEFTWTNFARIDGNSLIIDDVLVTSSGNPWLQRLGESQSLTIVAPEDYGVRTSADGVSPQEGRLHWEGPEEFTAESLEVTLTGSSTITENPGMLLSRVVMFGLIPVAAVLLLVVLYLARVGRITITVPPVGRTTGGTQTPSPEPAGQSSTEPAEPEPEPQEEDIDEELLSDEERVERLLSKNGGRMKQANIVKETDWSNAKVSQLLSAMEEEGRINKLRIGRENLISFPDEDITETDE